MSGVDPVGALGGLGPAWLATLAGLGAAAITVLLARPRVAGRRLASLGPAALEEARPGGDQGPLRRLRAPLALSAATAGWALVGGPPGLLAAVVLGVVAWRVLSRVEAPSVVRRREQLDAELPLAVDLLAAVLEGGGSVTTGLELVGAALPGPVHDELAAIRHRLELGVDPVTVWAAVAVAGPLAPVGRAMCRAHQSGAAVAAAVGRLAVELRARRRTETEQRARSVDVKASGPLGVCFLPAFVLLGIVPMVAGLFSSMRLFG